MGVAAWIERIKRVQELELKVRQLQREEAAHDNRVVIPTTDEIERYGQPASRLPRRLFNRPDLFLGIIVILGPIVATAYQMYVTTQRERSIDAALTQVQSQIDTTDRAITEAAKQLKFATDQALIELSGQGLTRALGAGPVYRALATQRNEIASRLEDLQRQKEQFNAQRLALEMERRASRPKFLSPDGER
jgi:hypothetical protein